VRDSDKIAHVHLVQPRKGKAARAGAGPAHVRRK
jgi:hypothetical protein